MIVYKFKSLEPFENAVDLIVNERVYCPTPEQLNDPLEGMLGVKGPAHDTDVCDDENIVRLFKYWGGQRRSINSYRVCSFSRSFDSPLMWSYYGNGHSGMCVELDIGPYTEQTIEVQYVKDLSEVDHSSAASRLRYKLNLWQHEQEVRVLVNPEPASPYLSTRISRILIGTRLADRYIKPLIEICRLKGIVLNVVSFDTSGRATRVGWNMSRPKPTLEAEP